MKKIMALLLAVLMLFAFVACDTGNGGSGGTGGSTDGNPAAYVGMWTGTMGPNLFSLHCLDFQAEVDSHHGGRWDIPVGKLRGKASWESLEGKPLIP